MLDYAIGQGTGVGTRVDEMQTVPAGAGVGGGEDDGIVGGSVGVQKSLDCKFIVSLENDRHTG